MHLLIFNFTIQECVIEMFQDMFGEDSVPKLFKGEKLHVTVDGKTAFINLQNLVSLFLIFYIRLNIISVITFNNIIGSSMRRGSNTSTNCTHRCNKIASVYYATENSNSSVLKNNYISLIYVLTSF